MFLLRPVVRPGRDRSSPWFAWAIAFLLAAGVESLSLIRGTACAEDVSAPVILQYFESTYDVIEKRAPDIFKAGYGSIYTPPPGRSDQGNFSVGYDQYDRFDLGKPGTPTMYGTETGIKTLVGEVHKFADYYVDFVINHNGYSDLGTPGFLQAGGYPGMVLVDPANGQPDGDFNSSFEWGDINGRLAGLIDIDHATNIRLVRNPVPGMANNIPAGTQPAYGRLANVPDENNRRFYPDRNLQPIMLYDPHTGEQNIAVYPFNLGSPLAGDPVEENATGYLMRNAQWLVQAIGIDGFRIDAAKHVQGFSLDYFDRAVYRSSFRGLLNGQQKQILSWCEVFDGNQDYLQTFVQKTIDPGNPGRIGANRDTLDFPLFFALQDNLTGNGLQNSWYNVRSATLDLHGDGMHNGSQGVMFAQSHDSFGPYLNNVAHAYVLMQPGNAILYYNARQFGTNRDFPKDGRGDALGGAYGNAIPGLVDIRNRWGRGNYVERWVEKENFAFERSGSCVVLLSNRLDAGYDSRTLLTNFNPGTRLIELTGNASDSWTDPYDDIPSMVVVNDDRTINIRFLRNSSWDTWPASHFTGNGYLIYGLAAPQGTLALGGVARTLPGTVPVLNGSPDANAYANATTRLSDLRVVTGDSFQVQLNTTAVNLLNNPAFREREADGDNALLSIDGGIDLNGNGHVDYTQPNTPSYGFEEFYDQKSPGWFNADGNGVYRQTVDATRLSEGTHYLTVRAFRHREDGGPAIFTDWKEVVYIDRLRPVSVLASFNPVTAGVNENRDLVVRSTDQTADNVHMLLDLGADISEADVLGRIGSATQADKLDRDLFKKYYSGLTHGNHAVTVVTYEPTGNYNVQRFAGLWTDTLFGRGLGDLNFDGYANAADVSLLSNVYQSANQTFNPAADVNGDGRIDAADVGLMGSQLIAAGADGATMDAYRNLAQTVPYKLTWNGAAGDIEWTSPANWGGMYPVAGKPLEFGPPLAGRRDNHNGFTTGTLFGGITFTADAGSHQLRGNGIKLAGPVQNHSSSDQEIGMALELVAGGGEFDDGGHVLTLNGAVHGPGMLKKLGAGTLVLAAANDYAGGTDVTAGVLLVTDPNALPSGGDLTIRGGARVVLHAGLNVAGTVRDAQNIAHANSAAVPEPATLALVGCLALCLAVGGLTMCFRRRGRK
jgi:autotransporter-associated beta strand protein